MIPAKRTKFRSFQVKVTVVLILAMLFSGALSDFLIYRFSLAAQFNQLREKLMTIAQTASLLVDADTLRSIKLDHTGMDMPQYQTVLEKLKKIKEVNPLIKYIYTMAATDIPGRWQFIVDPDATSGTDFKKGLSSTPGDYYDASRFPEMMKGFNGPAADKQLEVDEWGVTLSGYAPIRDAHGRAVAVLGVDIRAEDVYRTQQTVHRRALVVLVIGVVLSLVLGYIISRHITLPLQKLVEGTRRVARGDLHYRIDAVPGDEIGELAESFNEMERDLYESRKRLHSYFYRIVQSLVRILEAKDPYIKGHSEKVAEYAQKIASALGFDQDRVEFVREAAVLHDIGKLGIQESILNKKEKLTEAEWEIIRTHPIIGEDILRPVMFNKEMLAVIRGHHERYDGTGYPDKSSGAHINLCAQILSVADAYEAMTSPRAYRAAFPKEEAIAELTRNRGSQFNPQIVDVFMSILEKDPTI
jgi:putative nucleotidyltransferase with HDIG domain